MKRNSSNRKYNSGFTLVELIVVIAILAILAGVGAVGYGAYIEYAKKGQDKATVGEIMNALELADYSDPTLFGDDPSGYFVALSSEGVVGSNAAVQKALDDAGIDATLSYEKWAGADAGIIANKLKTALDGLSFLDGENVNLTYAGVATQSWDAVKNAVEQMNALFSGNGFRVQGGDVKNMGPALVLAAAEAANESHPELDWKNFNPSTDNKTASLPALVARNYSFAEYLRQHCDYEGLETDIEALQNVLQTANGFIDGSYIDPFSDTTKNQEFQDAARAYLETQVGTTGLTQAQIDNKGYNQMMASMYEQYGSQLNKTVENGQTYYKFTGNASTFWDEAGGLLSTAGQMAQMTASQREDFISKLPSEGKVVQVIIEGRNADGTLRLRSNPSDASPKTESTGDGGCSHDHTETLDIIVDKPDSYTVNLCMTAGVTQCTLYAKKSGGSDEAAFTIIDLDALCSETLKVTATESGPNYKSITITALKSGAVTLNIQCGRNVRKVNVVIYP